MKIRELFSPSTEKTQITKILQAIFESSKKDDILRYLHRELELGLPF